MAGIPAVPEANPVGAVSAHLRRSAQAQRNLVKDPVRTRKFDPLRSFPIPLLRAENARKQA